MYLKNDIKLKRNLFRGNMVIKLIEKAYINSNNKFLIGEADGLLESVASDWITSCFYNRSFFH